MDGFFQSGLQDLPQTHIVCRSRYRSWQDPPDCGCEFLGVFYDVIQSRQQLDLASEQKCPQLLEPKITDEQTSGLVNFRL